MIEKIFTLLPQCPLHSVAGIPCPTCGSGRATLAILHGNIVEAILWNPLFVLGGAAFLAWLAIGLVRHARTKKFPDLLPTPFVRISIASVIGVNWIYLIVRGV